MIAFQSLWDRIENKTARLVVIGLGYVGVPLSARFAQVGFGVTGLDVNASKVAAINAGRCPIAGKEPGLADLVAEAVAAGWLRATTDYAVCQQADAILIAVETPVDSVHQPRYRSLRAALRALALHLRPGTMVIVESTVAPGTMDRLVRPILEARGSRRSGRDFYLAHCPERVMPGLLLRNLARMSRVVGGDTPEAARLAQALYRHIVEAELDLADCVTAELVKTVENAYRDVQIAFANELALICEHVGANVWQVRDLVNKSPGRNVLLPGAGVGGHCLPKDPWLLIYGASDLVKAKLIPAAREINDYMPLHMAELTVDALHEVGQEIEDARVAVLGFAYLENSDDTRNSPSKVLVARLQELGAEVVVHDPWVSEYRTDLEECVQGCDAVVLMVAHDAYLQLDWGSLKAHLRHPVVVDGRRVVTDPGRQLDGFVFRGVGRLEASRPSPP
ncbi:MAG: nucleotide sugar dehydrogenase [Anaerolineae bacterium]|nr:MAG: nucleotide sugar dehydrogenase [Anaerolineae bacterium]